MSLEYLIASLQRAASIKACANSPVNKPAAISNTAGSTHLNPRPSQPVRS